MVQKLRQSLPFDFFECLKPNVYIYRYDTFIIYVYLSICIYLSSIYLYIYIFILGTPNGRPPFLEGVDGGTMGEDNYSKQGRGPYLQYFVSRVTSSILRVYFPRMSMEDMKFFRVIKEKTVSSWGLFTLRAAVLYWLQCWSKQAT